MASLAHPSIYAFAGDLYDACGSAFVPIGVDHHGFINGPEYGGPPPNLDATSFVEIAKTGANAVKIAWRTPSNDAHPDFTLTQLDVQVQAAIDAGLIPIVTLYDAIGPDNWAEFETIVQWWEDPATVAWVNGADATGRLRSEYLILNLAVEAGPATGSPYTSYVSAYTDATTRLRSCLVGDPCYTGPIMIDADGWGRDDASLVAGAPSWIAAEPRDNLIMSWHPYTPWSARQLRSRMDRLVSTGLPVIVSEFANKEPSGSVS